MAKLKNEKVQMYAACTAVPATAEDTAAMAKELLALRDLTACFESMLEGVSKPTFAGWENGAGINVGDGIEEARRAYAQL